MNARTELDPGPDEDVEPMFLSTQPPGAALSAQPRSATRARIAGGGRAWIDRGWRTRAQQRDNVL